MADHRGGGPDRALLSSTSSPSVFPRSHRADRRRSPVRSCCGATPASCVAIFGSTLGLAGIAGQRDARTADGVGTPVLRHTLLRSSWPRSAVSEAGRRVRRVVSLRTRLVYDEATDEWVLNGTKTWITNGGIADIHVVVASVDPALGSWGQASFIVPPKTRGDPPRARSSKKMGTRASHTAEVVLDDCRIPGRLPARRQGEARREAWPGPARASAPRGQAAMATFEAPARPSGPRPSASPGRPTSTRWTTRRNARPSVGRSSRTRRSPSNWPT